MGAPKRIQRKRTKGWKMPEGAVYVGRGPGSDWGNPYRVGDPGVPDVATAVRLYARVFEDGAWSVKLARDDLRGRDLACWCPLDQPCHADVLLEIANGGEQ